MKISDLLLIGGAALAVFFVARKVSAAAPAGKASTSSIPSGGTSWSGEIANNALPGDPGYGWRYFSDGTVIDNQGNYYSGGKMVWSPQTGAMIQ